MTDPHKESEKLIRHLCDKAAAGIGEHADSVVIIVTYPAGLNKDGHPATAHYKTGRGNYYAQRGSVIEWIDATRETSVSTPLDQPPEPGDEWKSEN